MELNPLVSRRTKLDEFTIKRKIISMTKKEIIKEQVSIIKSLINIAKLKPRKTFKGSLIRAGKMAGLINRLKYLELLKKGQYCQPKDFEEGGIVGTNADKIFVDGHEHIINLKPSDDDL